MSHIAALPKICQDILKAKAEQGLTFADLAAATGRDEVYIAAVCYGQAKPTLEDLGKLAEKLNFAKDALAAPGAGLGDGFYPVRGTNWEAVPKDPLLYRLYEILIVYGYPFKHIIHEKLGDGIMSAIDFSAHIDTYPNPAGGNRVKITLDGKFLPYGKW